MNRSGYLTLFLVPLLLAYFATAASQHHSQPSLALQGTFLNDYEDGIVNDSLFGDTRISIKLPMCLVDPVLPQDKLVVFKELRFRLHDLLADSRPVEVMFRLRELERDLCVFFEGVEMVTRVSVANLLLPGDPFYTTTWLGVWEEFPVTRFMNVINGIQYVSPVKMYYELNWKLKNQSPNVLPYLATPKALGYRPNMGMLSQLPQELVEIIILFAFKDNPNFAVLRQVCQGLERMDIFKLAFAKMPASDIARYFMLRYSSPSEFFYWCPLTESCINCSGPFAKITAAKRTDAEEKRGKVLLELCRDRTSRFKPLVFRMIRGQQLFMLPYLTSDADTLVLFLHNVADALNYLQFNLPPFTGNFLNELFKCDYLWQCLKDNNIKVLSSVRTLSTAAARCHLFRKVVHDKLRQTLFNRTFEKDRPLFKSV